MVMMIDDENGERTRDGMDRLLHEAVKEDGDGGDRCVGS
jgi:hypothetical protein